MIKANASISLKERQSLRLGGFLGVDLSSSPFEVSPRRATKMRNLINEYGTNRKRKGWRQVKQLDSGIEGIYEYTYKDEKQLLVMSAHRLFSFPYDGALGGDFYNYQELNSNSASFVGGIMNRTGSSPVAPTAFYHNEKIYFVGNGVHVYGTWDGGDSFELRELTASDVYVPTTTININYDGYTDGTEAEDIRATLEDANRLTAKRKNTLVGRVATVGADNKYEYSATWTLDASATDAPGQVYLVDIEIERIAVTEESSGTPSGGSGGVATCAEIGDETEETVKIETVRVGVQAESDFPGYGRGGNLYVYTVDDAGNKTWGAYAGSIRKNKLTLDINTTPPISDESNITVTFAVNSEEYGEDARKMYADASCGALFGADGNSDRLFLVAGGKNNVEIFSEPDNFTYFPFRNTLTIGTGASKIIGHQRLEDGTLAVFKEKCGNEPSVFYLTGSTVTEYEGDAISDMYALFKATAAGLGEALISSKALCNFGGDVLMLSENGVFGIVRGTSAASGERYTRERSRSINAALTKHSLKNAAAVVFRDKYYLSVNGRCYVADARFTYAPEGSLDGAYNYEWWVWDNLPADCFAVIDGRLYFGTSEGKLCVYDPDSSEYSDYERLDSLEGEVEISATADCLAYSHRLSGDMMSGYKMFTPRCDLYAVVCDNPELLSGKIIVPGSKSYLTEPDAYNPIRIPPEGSTVYLTHRGSEQKEAYTVGAVTRGVVGEDSGGKFVADVFALYFGEEVSLEGEFTLHKNLNGKRLFISDVPEDGEQKDLFKLTEREGGEALRLSACILNLAGEPEWSVLAGEPLIGSFEKLTPVVAEWYTPILDLGTNAYSKSLTRLTVSCEPSTNGKVNVGYETRAVSTSITARSGGAFDLTELSFENFTFDTVFATSYTAHARERNFNYIIFRYVSDTAADCAVNDITAEYKINRRNIGVR